MDLPPLRHLLESSRNEFQRLEAPDRDCFLVVGHDADGAAPPDSLTHLWQESSVITQFLYWQIVGPVSRSGDQLLVNDVESAQTIAAAGGRLLRSIASRPRVDRTSRGAYPCWSRLDWLLQFHEHDGQQHDRPALFVMIVEIYADDWMKLVAEALLAGEVESPAMSLWTMEGDVAQPVERGADGPWWSSPIPLARASVAIVAALLRGCEVQASASAVEATKPVKRGRKRKYDAEKDRDLAEDYAGAKKLEPSLTCDDFDVHAGRPRGTTRKAIDRHRKQQAAAERGGKKSSSGM